MTGSPPLVPDSRHRNVIPFAWISRIDIALVAIRHLPAV
jgi:hypothetical protein